MRVRMFWMSVLAITLMATAGCKKEYEGQYTSHQGTSTPSKDSPVSVQTPTTTPTPTANVPTGEPKVTKLTAKLPGDGQPFMEGQAVQLPIIAWGGDWPWIYCAGGTDGTHQGTICAKHGVNIRIVKGDDYAVQLADYRARKTPLLRNTLGTLGKYWETLCKEDPGLCPRPWFMETKSKGDFLVCREHVKDVSSLVGGCKNPMINTPRKCKIAAMKDGPWDSFLVTVVVEDAKAKWEDVELVWVKNLSGETDSGDAVFRNDPSVDCTMAITPDMTALTGGVTSKGTGADKTIPGAHVVTSTFHRRDGGIIDGLAVSAEWSLKNGQWLHAALAAYQEASEELMRLSRAYNGGGGSVEYEQAMAAMVAVYPTELKEDPEEANYLYLDAEFLGIAGNVSFFESTAVGVTYHQKWANTTAKLLGTAQSDVTFGNSLIDWNHSAFSKLASRSVKQGSKFKGEATAAELKQMSDAGTLGANTMVRFSARFAADDDTITDCSPFHPNFKELIESARRYSSAPIVVRAHYDPTRLIAEIMAAGVRNKILDQQGTAGNYTYFYKGEPLSLENIQPWLRLLEDPYYKDGVDSEGQPFVGYITQAQEKSQARAKALAKCLLDYAKSSGEEMDTNRVHTEGVGMAEPIVVKARSLDQAAANRRAECTLVKVSGESLTNDMLNL